MRFFAGYFCPFGTQGDNLFIKVESNASVGTNEHCLALYRTPFFHPFLIVGNEVFGYSLQAVGVSQNALHFGNGFLAFLYLVFIGTFFCTLLIIIFYFLQFLIVKQNLGSTSFVHNTPCDAIFHRFGHRIGIHHLTEYVNRGINRSTRKTNIRGIGQ